ncbi:hypothetical protein ALC57_00633 [Trachymyrmex cornetzi]|uniref:Uncharacterized protein n=1 Tax=Trachymyrmex cornetzi TaxID=471704 RepID=A0A151JR67_9HYME|nr:hypothetical protein ALC57_00633 [Trachymyrmex cornetzi]
MKGQIRSFIPAASRARARATISRHIRKDYRRGLKGDSTIGAGARATRLVGDSYVLCGEYG